MIINETELKQIYRESINSRERERREDCPSLDALLSFFDPKARRKKKLRIVDHVSHCPACLREFGFLAELQRNEADLFAGISMSIAPEPHPRSSKGPGAPRLTWRLSSAFAGTVLALLSLVVILADRGTVDGIRGIGSAITAVRPVGSQPAAELLVFEWQRAQRVDFYVVEVFDDSLLRLWSSPRTPSTRVQVPRAGPPSFAFDRTYYWMITGYSGDVKVMESTLIEFRLTGPQKRN